jgi:hypothetical protein
MEVVCRPEAIATFGTLATKFARFQPLENLFAWMKKYVEDKLPSNENTLRAAVEEAFENIPVEHTIHLMDSMRVRLTQAIHNKGARTKY